MSAGADTLQWLVRDWERSLKARNRSPRTVQSYWESVRQLIAYAGVLTGSITPCRVSTAITSPG